MQLILPSSIHYLYIIYELLFPDYRTRVWILPIRHSGPFLITQLHQTPQHISPGERRNRTVLWLNWTIFSYINIWLFPWSFKVMLSFCAFYLFLPRGRSKLTTTGCTASMKLQYLFYSLQSQQYTRSRLIMPIPIPGQVDLWNSIPRLSHTSKDPANYTLGTHPN
jgi:hypothetical protein